MGITTTNDIEVISTTENPTKVIMPDTEYITYLQTNELIAAINKLTHAIMRSK